MNYTFNSLRYWQYIAGFLLVMVVLILVNLYWSVDLYTYRHLFDLNKSQGFLARLFAIDLSKDPSYFVLQTIASGWLNFEIFLGLIIFFSLALKFFALLRVNIKLGILDVVPYILVLGFLHEGIQLRIAIALSISLWAIILFAKNERPTALAILAIASTFHISSATFFFVFLLVYFFEKLGIIFLYLWIIIAEIVAYAPIIPNILGKVAVATNARFLIYLQDFVLQSQNTTSLFNFFVLFVIFLSVYIWYYYRPTSEVWKNLYTLALISSLLAIQILQIFRFSVVISSRLADLLLLPVLLVLGATLTQLRNEKRYLPLSFMCVALIFYCVARALTSFNPGLIRGMLS